MAKQTFTTGQVLTAAQVNSLQSNDFNQTVSVKTASYTLVAADKGTRIEFNTSGSVTCTVNTGLFDAGDTLIIQNRGAGVVTVTAGTATVNTSATLALSQYDAGTLYFVSASAAIFFNTDAGGGSPLTTKGDLYTFSTVDARLPVGTNGYTLVADSSETTGLKWAAPSSGALVLIKGQTTFSNVANTGTTFDNIFSSTYTTYLFVIEEISAATATNEIKFRTISSGSAGTSNNYNGNTQYSSRDGTTITNNPQSTQTSFTLAPAGTASEERCSSYTITFTNVGVSKEPRWYGQGVYGVNTGSINFGYVYFGGAQHNGSTAVQGIQLLSSSSNITGSVSVYAYVES